jgi:hypothetical protein
MPQGNAIHASKWNHEGDCGSGVFRLTQEVEHQVKIDARPSRLIDSQRTKNKLIFLSCAILMFSVAMTIMYYAMR